MIEGVPLKGSKYESLQFIRLGHDARRLFYKLHFPEDNEGGFDFFVVSWCSSSGKSDDVWLDDECNVEEVAHGNVFFDGLRHFYVPYWFYVDLSELEELAKAIRELHAKFHPGHEPI